MDLAAKHRHAWGISEKLIIWFQVFGCYQVQFPTMVRGTPWTLSAFVLAAVSSPTCEPRYLEMSPVGCRTSNGWYVGWPLGGGEDLNNHGRRIINLKRNVKVKIVQRFLEMVKLGVECWPPSVLLRIPYKGMTTGERSKGKFDCRNHRHLLRPAWCFPADPLASLLHPRSFSSRWSILVVHPPEFRYVIFPSVWNQMFELSIYLWCLLCPVSV